MDIQLNGESETSGNAWGFGAQSRFIFRSQKSTEHDQKVIQQQFRTPHLVLHVYVLLSLY